jgi:hypothetical protein
LIRQAAVAFLALLPLAVSIPAAYISWLAFPSLEAWHMIVTGLVWVSSFAVGTQLFWKAVELLAQKR